MNRQNRRARQASNLFSMLTPSQISCLKEVFSIIDQSKDEIICNSDLKNFLPSIVNENQMKEFENIEKNINFYALLSLLSDRFIGLNPKENIKNSLILFSDDKKTINKQELINYLSDEGIFVEDLKYCLSVFDSDVIEIDKLVNLLRHGEVEPDVKK